MKMTDRSQKVWSKVLALAAALVMLATDMSLAVPVLQAQSEGVQAVVSQEAACLSATPLVAGSSGLRSLTRQLGASGDWLSFSVQKGERYRLNAGAGGTGLSFTLFDGCSNQSHTYPVQQGEVAFTAQRNATYYVKVNGGVQAQRAAAGYRFDMHSLAAVPPSKMALADVPAELHRRALDWLEEMRGNPDMPEWNEARLGAEVNLIYRPDMAEAAYYDFLVEKPGSVGFEPAGFVQLSAGKYDYPVPHWNFTGFSPTQELSELASAGGSLPTQYYKLEALAYAAEYEQTVPLGISVVSTDVVNLGTLPPKFSGLEALPLDYAPDTTENVWTPAATTTDDSQTSTISATLQTNGPEEPAALAETDWSSWTELKTEYEEVYGVLLDGLEKDASENWSHLEGIAKDGESLLKDESRVIRAMSTLTVANITVTGEGADPQFLQQEQLSAGNLATGVRITVVGEPTEAYKELPVDVTIRYTNGISEAKRYLIINQGSLQAPNQLYLPLVAGDGSPQAVMASSVDAATIVNWGPWTEWWAAGGHAGQPLYNQIPPNTRVNNRACHSGCVPTAWAMLFGWADRRAAIAGSGWNHRFGIYRQNGGYGADAVAPIYESSDRGIENVMMELGRHMGTTCDGNQGGTSIDNEWKAQRYLDGRTSATVRTLVANGWWIFGTSIDDTRDRSISAIKGGQPVVISTWGHAPMAYGYRERTNRVRHCFIFCWYTTDYERQFYINKGWGGSGNGWIEAKTRFAGEILRN